MTGSQQKYEAERWLKCAQEVWAAARRIKDPKIRNEMEIIARSYERLAWHAGRRMLRQPGTEAQISPPKMIRPQGPEADPIAE